MKAQYIEKNRHKVQTPRTRKSLRFVMMKASFRKGYESFKEGLPFDSEAFTEWNEQWNYERGRQFAACYTGAIKINRRISLEALVAMDQLVRERAVI